MALDRFGQHFYAPNELLQTRGEAATHLVAMSLGIPGAACLAIGVVSGIDWLAAIGGGLFIPFGIWGNVHCTRVVRRLHGGHPWALRHTMRRWQISGAMWSPRVFLHAWRTIGPPRRIATLLALVAGAVCSLALVVAALVWLYGEFWLITLAEGATAPDQIARGESAKRVASTVVLVSGVSLLLCIPSLVIASLLSRPVEPSSEAEEGA